MWKILSLHSCQETHTFFCNYKLYANEALKVVTRETHLITKSFFDVAEEDATNKKEFSFFAWESNFFQEKIEMDAI